ncbi:MAG: hypothetical protein H0T72_07160 [Chloroflexia bacterium]|nr:hypothetical protein [Chloroflexia bacterium]
MTSPRTPFKASDAARRRLNDPFEDGFLVLDGRAPTDAEAWADEVSLRRMPFVTVITGSGQGGGARVVCSIANLMTLPADGYATEDVGQRMRRLMQAALAKNRKATLFNKNATVSAIDGLSLPAAKHLAADLAALTGVSLPLTARAAIDGPGFDA